MYELINGKVEFNIDNKNEISIVKKLNFDCINCKFFKNVPEFKYKSKKECINCIIEKLRNLKEEEFEKTELITFNYNQYIPKQDLKIFKEIIKIYFLIKKEIINEISKVTCINKGKSTCYLPDVIFNLIKIKDHFSVESFYKFLNFINMPNSSIDNTSIKYSGCKTCIKKVNLSIKKVKDKIKKSIIFSSLQNVFDSSQEENFSILELFLGPININSKILSEVNDPDQLKDVFSYHIEDFPMYNIHIKENDNYIELLYNITEEIGEKSKKTYQGIINQVKSRIVDLDLGDIILPIGEIFEKYKILALKNLKVMFRRLNKYELDNLSTLISAELLNLRKIFPILVDNQIEEIYLDTPYSYIYVDHQIFGRCRTPLQLNQNEINALKTFLRINSLKSLDESNPSLKTTIFNKYFHCRFSVDVSPLTPSGFALDIRKMNKKVFTLPELILKNMLSIDIAAFLIFSIINNLNILVVGETSSGKTTLINALDLYTPRHLRKIYIEEAPESLDLEQYNFHQLKYLINGDKNSKISSYKSEQIYRLLHRNPDIVYLGEILTAEEANAMFHCLSAGLRGFQTIHARDINSIINRWYYHFKINPSCFNDLDLVILVKNLFSKRTIVEISEIDFDGKEIRILPFYKLNNDLKTWALLRDFFESKIFKRNYISHEKRNKYLIIINILKEVITYLVKKKILDINQQLRIISKINNLIYKFMKMDVSEKDWRNLLENWQKMTLMEENN